MSNALDTKSVPGRIRCVECGCTMVIGGQTPTIRHKDSCVSRPQPELGTTGRPSRDEYEASQAGGASRREDEIDE